MRWTAQQKLLYKMLQESAMMPHLTPEELAAYTKTLSEVRWDLPGMDQFGEDMQQTSGPFF